MKRPWTAREVALATIVALLFAITAVLATEGLAAILLAGGAP